MTLAEFLAARLGEDEAAARASLDYEDREQWQWDFWDEACEADAAHYQRHGPARVLRQVTAIRAILAAHGWDDIGKFGSREIRRCEVCLSDRTDYAEMWEADAWPCLTLRHLAAIWVHHPDYDPAWQTP